MNTEVIELQAVAVVWLTCGTLTDWVALGIRKLLQNSYQTTCNNLSVCEKLPITTSVTSQQIHVTES